MVKTLKLNTMIDLFETLAEATKPCNLQNVSGSFPRCHYCGQFVNPNNDNVKMAVQYGFMGVDYDYYYHIKCARGTERT